MDDATLVVFGATGDMARRLLFPALYQLEQARLLSRLKVIAYARRDWDDLKIREVIKEGIEELAGIDISSTTWERFARRVTYVKGELHAEDMRALEAHLTGNAAFYLALPPDLFGSTADALAKAQLNDESKGWRRIVIEKPFGTDLESAMALNRELHQHWSEKQTFRIDHFLGKETVQNILIFRFTNRILDPVLNSSNVEYVEITAAETLGLEGRVTFYDDVGALRDMLQSHLMQLLALVAMEPLATWDNALLHDHKVEALHSVRPIDPEMVDEQAVRGQYEAAEVDGENVKGYREEDGIPADSTTETFAALKLYLDNWRWKGTPFYLRSGKRLQSDLSEVVIHFKEPPFRIPGEPWTPGTSKLVFRLRPHESINLAVKARKPGLEMSTDNLILHADYRGTSDASSAAYRQLILDLLEGEHMAFLRFDEVEWAWRILEPVLRAWQKGKPEPYPAGSDGPPCQERLLSPGHVWRSFAGDPIPAHGE
jgi:glucose-6-phosphate 1-dehydrogenase